MPRDLPPACRELVSLQNGVISRQQAIGGGMDPDVIDRLLRTGRWQCLQRGSYAVFTGEPPREAQLWAALHRAGPGAVLSHQTAAELFQLTDRPSSLIHLTIPAGRRVDGVPGAVIHRSRYLREARHPALLPPRTRIEETVLDLVQQAASFDTAFGWACTACQRRLTTAARIGASMAARSRVRWRAELSVALADIRDGVNSLLEYRYVHNVERAHGLPRAVRQAKIIRGIRIGYLDNLYQQYGVCVELDGRAAHPDDRRWQDIYRDNASAAEGRATLQVQLGGRIGAGVRNRAAGRYYSSARRLAGPGARMRPRLRPRRAGLMTVEARPRLAPKGLHDPRRRSDAAGV